MKKEMKKEKTFEKQMLEKHPNLYKGESCYICKADLRYLDKIHRINMEWYCDKCYKKKGYIFPNIFDPTKNINKNYKIPPKEIIIFSVNDLK